MKALKNFGLIFLVLVIMLSVAGCKSEVREPVAEPTETEKYIAENGEILASNFEKGFSTGENRCKASIKAQGNEIAFDVNLAGLENLDEDTKKEVQTALEGMKEILQNSFKTMKEEIPSLEKIVFNMNEENGKNLASVEIEY